MEGFLLQDKFTNITPNVFGVQGLRDAFVISVDKFALFNPFLAIITSNDSDVGKSINSSNFAPNRIVFGNVFN